MLIKMDILYTSQKERYAKRIPDHPVKSILSAILKLKLANQLWLDLVASKEQLNATMSSIGEADWLVVSAQRTKFRVSKAHAMVKPDWFREFHKMRKLANFSLNSNLLRTATPLEISQSTSTHQPLQRRPTSIKSKTRLSHATECQTFMKTKESWRLSKKCCSSSSS